MNRILFYLTPIVLCGILFAQGQEMEELSPHLLSDGNIKAINIQDQPQNVQVESSMSSIYLQFNISGLYSWLKDWKNQIQQYGTNPSTMSMTFGAEGGFVINRYVRSAADTNFSLHPRSRLIK